MAGRFDAFTDAIVTQYVQRGEGTGAISKMLSGLTFPILTVLAVQMIRDQQYIPLALIAVLMWTKVGFLVMLGAAVYFIVTKYWTGLALLGGYFAVSILSVHFGKRNVKKLLFSGKPMISPFESMPDLLVILVLECLFLAVALFTGGLISLVLWSVFGLVVLYHFGRYWFRLRPRWSQIHQPLMVRYAACAGHEAGQAAREQREFSFRTATQSLLKSVYPNREDHEIEEMVENARRKMQSFSDRELIAESIRRKNSSVPDDTVASVLGKIEEYLQTDEGSKLIVPYAVAEVVESVFGLDERSDYVLAVIEGSAK